MSAPFGLLLFAVEADLVRAAAAAGVDGIVVDWERNGKSQRQHGMDTEVNEQTVADLVRVRDAASCSVICRVNAYNPESAAEIESAIVAGADEVLVPMIRSAGEVERVLELAAGRCGVGILVETTQAVAVAPDLARLPISRAYVGLNDLSIDRRSRSIFDALLDGTVERVRSQFDVPFGFGGLTLPDRGWPIPCRDLIAEMARLDCSFSFLRRSFRRDVPLGGVADAVALIRGALEAARRRPSHEVAADRASLLWGIVRARAVCEDGADSVAVA